MRVVIFILFILISKFSSAQISQILTGTNENLVDLSIIGNKIIVSGTQTFLASSVNDGVTLDLIPKPVSTSFFNRIQRLDLNDLFIYSYSSSQLNIFHSIDCGNTWINKYNSNGCIRCEFSFHDTINGYMSKGNQLFKTVNSALSFSLISPPHQTLLVLVKGDKGNTVTIGGVNPSVSGIVVSKNRGNTWGQEWGMWNNPKDVFYYNNDTVFVLGDKGDFLFTVDGGNLWSNTYFVPLQNTNRVAFNSSKEGFVVGSNNQTIGMIAKTSDFGKTWYTYNTGKNCVLYDIAFLNDSIAFLSGSNGVLLRWNYKQSIFTGVDEVSLENIGIKIYPNPVSDKLKIEFIKNEVPIENISILNALGATLLESKELKKEMDVSFLEPGLYFLKIESGLKQKTIKFIKKP